MTVADQQPHESPEVASADAEVGHYWPARLWEWLAQHRPPGPFSPGALRSPLRGPWLTSVFGFVLLVGLPILILTGLLSYVAYQPQFAGNAFPAETHGLHLPFFAWPASPSWLYRVTQGTHVALGLVLVPVVVAKLWSVVPKLFSWPPARGVARQVQRHRPARSALRGLSCNRSTSRLHRTRWTSTDCAAPTAGPSWTAVRA